MSNLYRNIARKEAKRMSKSPYEPIRLSGEYFLKLVKEQGLSPKVEEVCGWMETLAVPKGVKGTFKLLGWQVLIVCALYGFKDVPDKVAVMIPRKNGKSSLASALGLAAMRYNDEASPEVTMFAFTMEQARICFKGAQDITHFSGDVTSDFRSMAYEIRDNKNNGVMLMRAADRRSTLGMNHSLLIVDEAALIPKNVYDTLGTGVSSTREFQKTLFISTASSDRNSYYRELTNAALNALRTGGEPPVFPILFMPADDGTQYPIIKHKRAWRWINPSLGTHILTMKTFEQQYKSLLASKQDTAFQTFHLNIWGTGEIERIASEEELKMMKWDADESIFENNACSVGIDTGSTAAMTSVALMTKVGGVYYARTVNFTCKEHYDRRVNDKSMQWLIDARKEGHLRISGDKRQDYADIFEYLKGLDERYPVMEYCYDTYNSGLSLSDDMRQVFGEHRAVQMLSQARARAPLTNAFLTAIHEGKLRVTDSRLFWWELLNAVLVDKNSWTDIQKEADGSPYTIDGVYAIMFGLRYWIENAVAPMRKLSASQLDKLDVFG